MFEILLRQETRIARCEEQDNNVNVLGFHYCYHIIGSGFVNFLKQGKHSRSLKCIKMPQGEKLNNLLATC